jgi:hypothetical protein
MVSNRFKRITRTTVEDRRFLKSLDTLKPTVTQADIAKHDQWTMESGTRGFFLSVLFHSFSTSQLNTSNCRKRWSVTACDSFVIKSISALSVPHALGIFGSRT